MGFLAGVVSEINRQEDAKERADRFTKELLERRKNILIPQIAERMAKRDAAVDAARNRVSAGISLGLTKDAAAILESSGQLGMELERLADLNKKGDLNKDYLKTVSEKIVESTDPDKAQAALKYVLQGSLSGDANDAVINALWFAESDEELVSGIQEAYKGMASSAGAGPSIAARQYTTRGAEIFSPSDRSSTQTTIAKSLSARLGLEINYDSNGNFISFQGEDAGAAEEILNNALDLYVEYRSNPEYLGDPFDVINPIGDNITILGDKGYSLQEIAQNKTFDVDVPEKPKTPGTGEDVVQDYTVNSGQNYTPEIIDDVFKQSLNGGFGQ